MVERSDTTGKGIPPSCTPAGVPATCAHTQDGAVYNGVPKDRATALMPQGGMVTKPRVAALPLPWEPQSPLISYPHGVASWCPRMVCIRTACHDATPVRLSVCTARRCVRSTAYIGVLRLETAAV